MEVIKTNKKGLFFELLYNMIFVTLIISISRCNVILCKFFSDHIIFSKILFWKSFECIFLIIFLGVIFYIVYFLIKPSRTIINLDKNGFSTIQTGYVNWNKLENLKIEKLSGTSYITFSIKGNSQKNNNYVFENPYIISLFYTGINPSWLYNKIVQYKEKALFMEEGKIS